MSQSGLLPDHRRSGQGLVNIAARSELKPQRKHDLPLQCGAVKCCVDNDTAARTVYAGDGTVEIDLIEKVEDVGAELNRAAFFQWDILCDRDVRLEKAGPAK